MLPSIKLLNGVAALDVVIAENTEVESFASVSAPEALIAKYELAEIDDRNFKVFV